MTLLHITTILLQLTPSPLSIATIDINIAQDETTTN